MYTYTLELSRNVHCQHKMSCNKPLFLTDTISTGDPFKTFQVYTQILKRNFNTARYQHRWWVRTSWWLWHVSPCATTSPSMSLPLWNSPFEQQCLSVCVEMAIRNLDVLSLGCSIDIFLLWKWLRRQSLFALIATILLNSCLGTLTGTHLRSYVYRH